MPKVLIVGATGYLGKRVASVLVRSGQHHVYGIARDEVRSKYLALQEVTPIVCTDPINDPTPYLSAIREHHIDIVVDVSGAGPESSKILEDVKKIGEERLQANKTPGTNAGPKLGFVYCSGTWVHGSNEKLVNDLDIAGRGGTTLPRRLVAWRVGLEDTVLASSDVLDVAIIRPALIYGYESTIWTSFILPLAHAARIGSTDSIQVPLEADAKPGLIHVDDVAAGFKVIVERLTLINGSSTYPVFDLVTSQESMRDIFAALASAWGYKGEINLVGAGDNLFAEAMSTTFRGSSARAQQLLGWKPTRLNGFVGDMERPVDKEGGLTITSKQHSSNRLWVAVRMRYCTLCEMDAGRSEGTFNSTYHTIELGSGSVIFRPALLFEALGVINYLGMPAIDGNLHAVVQALHASMFEFQTTFNLNRYLHGQFINIMPIWDEGVAAWGTRTAVLNDPVLGSTADDIIDQLDILEADTGARAFNGDSWKP
ncbi:hypothetical protein V495_01058 [Pseudogymnoascus sp. VKM F-4514 (FW-929)]|nr:hypothetical protein V495_01058 [Pseudogymnoascus sp. VKM F-4514 (FW-929)]KFY61630.1 hypothetical protein V497_02821 [Pseudogymnoascus sp. VKM F-4516 (FW-969)]